MSKSKRDEPHSHRLTRKIDRVQRAQRALALANAYEREHEREVREALLERAR